jgi:hypothetical protein
MISWTVAIENSKERTRDAYALQPGVKSIVLGAVSDLPVFSQVRSDTQQARKTGVGGAKPAAASDSPPLAPCSGAVF